MVAKRIYKTPVDSIRNHIPKQQQLILRNAIETFPPSYQMAAQLLVQTAFELGRDSATDNFFKIMRGELQEHD